MEIYVCWLLRLFLRKLKLDWKMKHSFWSLSQLTALHYESIRERIAQNNIHENIAKHLQKGIECCCSFDRWSRLCLEATGRCQWKGFLRKISVILLEFSLIFTFTRRSIYDFVASSSLRHHKSQYIKVTRSQPHWQKVQLHWPQFSTAFNIFLIFFLNFSLLIFTQLDSYEQRDLQWINWEMKMYAKQQNWEKSEEESRRMQTLKMATIFLFVTTATLRNNATNWNEIFRFAMKNLCTPKSTTRHCKLWVSVEWKWSKRVKAESCPTSPQNNQQVSALQLFLQLLFCWLELMPIDRRIRARSQIQICLNNSTSRWMVIKLYRRWTNKKVIKLSRLLQNSRIFVTILTFSKLEKNRSLQFK